MRKSQIPEIKTYPQTQKAESVWDHEERDGGNPVDRGPLQEIPEGVQSKNVTQTKTRTTPTNEKS